MSDNKRVAKKSKEETCAGTKENTVHFIAQITNLGRLQTESSTLALCSSTDWIVLKERNPPLMTFFFLNNWASRHLVSWYNETISCLAAMTKATRWDLMRMVHADANHGFFKPRGESGKIETDRWQFHRSAALPLPTNQPSLIFTFSKLAPLTFPSQNSLSSETKTIVTGQLIISASKSRELCPALWRFRFELGLQCSKCDVQRQN